MHMVLYAGRLGRDASVKTLESGKAVMEIALAIDIGWGERKRTEWVKGASWQERHHKIAHLLTKGRQITIVGKLSHKPYLKKDGQPEAGIEVDITEITLQGGGEGRTDSAPAQSRTPARPLAKPAELGFDDDLTF